MTINDMLEQGVIFQGKIQVDTWNDDGDSIVLFESDGVTELKDYVYESWADKNVAHIFPWGSNWLQFEVK